MRRPRGPAEFVLGCLFWSTAVAGAARLAGVQPGDGGWAWWAPVFMAGPALMALLVERTGEAPSPTLRRWGAGGVWVILGPVFAAAAIYGFAHGAGWLLDVVEVRGTLHTVEPGRHPGLWLLAAALGLAGALGEELGWRGYLQPRLMAQGEVRAAVLTGLAWAAFHAPLMVLAGYPAGEPRAAVLTVLLLCTALESWLWMRAVTAAGSLWPAVWFHAAHNVAAGHAFALLFVGPALWVGEDGVLSGLGHLTVGLPLGWALGAVAHRRAGGLSPPPRGSGAAPGGPPA